MKWWWHFKSQVILSSVGIINSFATSRYLYHISDTCNLVLTIVLRNSAKRCRWNREKNPNDYEPMLNIQRQVPACVTDMGWTDLIIYNILYSETIDIYPELESFTLISDQIWYFKINQFVWMHLLGIKYVKNKMNW